MTLHREARASNNDYLAFLFFWQVLETWGTVAENYANSNVTKPKRAIDTASEVTGWTWHDLRRTLRTGLSRLGTRPDVSERVIGHAVGGTLGQTYDTHEYRGEKLAALEAWGEHVMAVVEGREAENVVEITHRRLA